MKRLVLYLGLVFLLVGCGPFIPLTPVIPLTPEERKAREIRSHCEDVGKIARDKFVAYQLPLLEKEIGGSVFVFRHMEAEARKERVEQTAYRECMYRYGYLP